MNNTYFTAVVNNKSNLMYNKINMLMPPFKYPNMDILLKKHAKAKIINSVTLNYQLIHNHKMSNYLEVYGELMFIMQMLSNNQIFTSNKLKY